MTSDTSWRNLELRVAKYFERSGYAARTNHKERGRSGLVHEIDVLVEMTDAAGRHRVAVECKAWRSPIEKEVIYKLEKVMQDVGLSKGIVISAGGLRSGARVAAEQAHIDVWGRDEIRHFLGDEALAGLPLAAPDEAPGIEASVTLEMAEREIRKARKGFAGIGGEDVASISLIWAPAVEFQLAATRVQPGLIRAREEVIRRWNLFEELTGRLLGQRDEPRSFVTVSLGGAVLRAQKTPPQIVADMKRTLGKHRTAKTETAQKVRQAAYNAIGLPGSTREFTIEAEKAVFVPFFVGSLRHKGTERLIAIHAQLATRSVELEHALHERIDVVRNALQDAASDGTPGNGIRESAPAIEAASPPIESAVVMAPTCRCGQGMVLRHRKVDSAAFWGCSTFPRCRQTLPID